MRNLKKYLTFIVVIFSLAAARPAKAQYRSYWHLDVDTLKVTSPDWFIQAQNFIPILGGITNYFAGYQSGYHIFLGTYDVGVGYQSMFNAERSRLSLAVGYQSLYSDTAAYRVLAIGTREMYLSEGDTDFVGIGAFLNSLLKIGSLKYGVVVGTDAATYASSLVGSIMIGDSVFDNHSHSAVDTNSVMIGRGAAALASFTKQVIAIGPYTGYSLYKAAGDIFIGDSAGYGVTGSDSLMIGNGSGHTIIEGSMPRKTLTMHSTLTLDSTLETGGNVTTASDFSTTTTTLTNVPGLSVYLQPNTTYQFSGELFTTIAASAGETETIYYGGYTPAYVIFGIVAEDNSVVDVSNWSNTIGNPFSDNSGGGVSVMVKFHGTIHTGSVGADLTVRYAQSTAQTTANVVKEGSFLNVYRSH